MAAINAFKDLVLICNSTLHGTKTLFTVAEFFPPLFAARMHVFAAEFEFFRSHG